MPRLISTIVDRLSLYLMALSFIALALGFLLPGHYSPYRAFNQEMASWIGLVCVWLSIAIISRGAILVSWTVFIVLGVSFIPLIQYALGIIDYFGDALLSSLYLAGLALSITVGLTTKNLREGWIEGVVGVLLFSAIYSSGIALGQWLQLDMGDGLFIDFPFQSLPSGNIGQRNNFAVLVMVGIGAVLYLEHKKRLGSFGTTLSILFFILAIAVCQSRTPWAISAVLLVWLWAKRDVIPSFQLHLYRLASAVLFYLLTVYYLLPWLSEILFGPTADLFIRNSDMDNRLMMWYQLLQAVKVGDVFGYGWGQVNLAQALFSERLSETLRTGHSHNIFVDLLIWNGPILGIVLIGLIVYWMIWQIRRCKVAESFYLLCLIGPIAVHSLLEYSFQYAYFLVPLGLLIGSVEATSGAPHISLRLGWLFHGSLASVCFVLMFIMQSEYTSIKQAYLRATLDELGVKKAKELGSPDASIHLLTQLQAQVDLVGTRATEVMSVDQLEKMGKATLHNYEARYFFRYAVALGLNNRCPEARIVLKKIQNLYPGTYLRWQGAWEFRQGENEKLGNCDFPVVKDG